MRALAIGAAVAAFFSTSVLAAAAPAPAIPDIKDYATSAEVQALIENARRTRTNQPTIAQPLLKLAPYAANLEYRASVGPASVHEDRAELFYVIQGSAALTLGGELVNPTRTGTNLSSASVKDGFTRKVEAGDFFIVPQKTPHWFSTILDGPLVLMSIHLPRN